MGLCKCPKKKVTQHFCFEHKVNVCEYCMVTEHQKCVVQPYLQWLEDSSFQSICTLCQQSLAPDDCVRMLCYHIFHWTCLNKHMAAMPPNTAPAGYTCPDCHRTLFPSSAASNPIAVVLKKVLSNTEWARVGLGLPLIDRQQASFSDVDESSLSNYQRIVPQVVHHNPALPPSSVPVPVSTYLNNSESTLTFSSTRKSQDHADGRHNGLKSLHDIDEDKYRTKSPLEFLSRWFRSHSTIANQRNFAALTYRRWIVVGILVFIAFCTLLHYFLKFGRESADRDLSLDPLHNPHVRVRDDGEEVNP